MSLKMMIVVNLRKSPRLRAYFGSGIGITVLFTPLFCLERMKENNNEHVLVYVFSILVHYTIIIT